MTISTIQLMSNEMMIQNKRLFIIDIIPNMLPCCGEDGQTVQLIVMQPVVVVVRCTKERRKISGGRKQSYREAPPRF